MHASLHPLLHVMHEPGTSLENIPTIISWQFKSWSRVFKEFSFANAIKDHFEIGMGISITKLTQ